MNPLGIATLGFGILGILAQNIQNEATMKEMERARQEEEDRRQHQETLARMEKERKEKELATRSRRDASEVGTIGQAPSLLGTFNKSDTTLLGS